MTRRRDRRPDERPFRFDRTFPGLGIERITNSSGTRSVEEFDRRNAILTKLAEDGQDDVLRAFKREELAIEDLVKADRDGKLTGANLLAKITLRGKLFPAGAERVTLLAKMATGADTAKRYGVSLGRLKAKGGAWLTAESPIADLERVDWTALQQTWGAGASDWMHLRRAVSRLLTVTLGHKWHPTRLAVMAAFPTAEEEERVADLSVEQFQSIIEAVPEHARPAYMALVLTGFRYKEYRRCGKEHLDPARCLVRSPHSKTKKGRKPVKVDERMWPWIEAGIPAPLAYSWLRRYLIRACLSLGLATKVPNQRGKLDKEGKPRLDYQGPRLHDLRHLHGQLITDAGLPEWMAQRSLRHASGAMTRRYVTRGGLDKAASAIADQLDPGLKKHA